jgi:hypothetical protein
MCKDKTGLLKYLNYIVSPWFGLLLQRGLLIAPIMGVYHYVGAIINRPLYTSIHSNGAVEVLQQPLKNKNFIPLFLILTSGS